ncbi:MAG: GspE/PulE family protein, partial [Planctomycetota bacterium]
MASFDKKLGTILVKENKLSKDDLGSLLVTAARDKRPLSELIVKQDVVGRDELLGMIANHANISPVNLERIKLDKEVIEILPQEVAISYKVVPLTKIADFLTIAVANPFDILKLDDIRIITGCELRPVVALEDQVEQFLELAYRTDSQAMEEILDGFSDSDVELKEAKQEDDDMDLATVVDGASPVVKMVNKIIYDGVTQKVSDIHIEPYEKKVVVRYRHDGTLVEVLSPPKRMQNSLTSRLKIMAKLDIAEKRKPQDGKFQMKMGNKAIDFRVSTLPVVWGEKVVLRILDSSNLALDIKKLGFEPKCLDDFLWSCEQPYGMILVTGPTGSGKSTTLYSGLAHILVPDINIVTVEDPVEYTMEGVNQVPVNPRQGLTFAGALRSILRQDPDVILLGEIRDKETIEIAVKAALTGHLVLSTLHTNDAPSTITRMVDMGLDSFMVASSVNLICAQRLAKRLCASCREPIAVPPKRLLELGLQESDLENETQIYKPVGCGKCTNGYK